MGHSDLTRTADSGAVLFWLNVTMECLHKVAITHNSQGDMVKYALRQQHCASPYHMAWPLALPHDGRAVGFLGLARQPRNHLVE